MTGITTHTTFGQALHGLRERRGLSEKEFGRPMGWRADVVKKYEANQVDPGNLVILRICSAWDVTYLASGRGMAFLDNQP